MVALVAVGCDTVDMVHILLLLEAGQAKNIQV
jgi:hypothetical protein